MSRTTTSDRHRPANKDVRVIFPWVENPTQSWDPRAEAALATHCPEYESRQIPVEPDATARAYHDLLSELWAAGEDFCLVEHDIEIRADVLPAFESCPEPWCTFPYLGRPYKHYPVPVLRVALGCTRFRSEFLKTNAGVLEAMLPGPASSPRNPRHWRRCDSLLASALQRRGFRAHEHEPHVVHHHDYANETTHAGWIPPG